MIFDVSPDDIGTLRGRSADGFQVVTGNRSNCSSSSSCPKSASDPLADRRVRQALNMAVDVNAIVDNLFNGLGRRQSSPIMDGALGNDPSLAPYDYNPTFASSCWPTPGYPNGFSATMDLSSSDNPNEALAVIGQLQQVGVTVKPQTFEVGTFNANWSQDKSGDLRMARWGGPPGPGQLPELHHRVRRLPRRRVLLRSRTRPAWPSKPRPPSTRTPARGSTRRSPACYTTTRWASTWPTRQRLRRWPPCEGWPGPTGRDYLMPTNITLQ